ncbi:espin-like protein [Anolis sagrei]|uniref:espin-like protein n=1 Tax=Anolis sagrei TaxID=38937 RepID=UPI0035213580
MTEEDFLSLEKQIQNLQVMHKVQKVETELGQLEQQLQQLLPVSAALAKEQHFTVNPKSLRGQEEDLPAWCSKISALLKSMAVLLTALGGKAVSVAEMVTPETAVVPSPTEVVKESLPGIARSQSFSCRRLQVEKEISQCGVSVKNLKANYELQLRAQELDNDDAEARVYKRKLSLPVGTLGREPILEEDYVSNLEALEGEGYEEEEVQEEEDVRSVGGEDEEEASFSPDHSTRSLPVQTDLSCVQDYIDMRKERIVYLFLEHWKKWTFNESGKKPTHEDDVEAEDGKKPSEDDRLLYFMKQRQVVGKLITHWRSIISQVPTRQIRRLSRSGVLYWPEHFLPHLESSGRPVAYDDLTLDLFMLGYFQLLEMNLSRQERKFRHLLCYEMFDRLGSHSWDLIRRFHKVVIEEVEAGRRDWADGFEDLKMDFFGEKLPQEPPDEPPETSPVISRRESSQTLVSVQGPPPPEEEEEEEEEEKEEEEKEEGEKEEEVPETRKAAVPLVSEPGEFCNEDVCRYIDRSFSFWKEKEAEMFDI